MEVAKRHNYDGADLVPICIVVSCFKDGVRDRLKIARKLRKAVPDYYASRQNFRYSNPIEWAKEDKNGFLSHLWRLREKAKRPEYASEDSTKMFDSIPRDYHHAYRRRA